MTNDSRFRIAFVSVYPPKNSTDKLSGVASYTKNLIANFSKKCKIYVFANKLKTAEQYKEENINIIRCWSRDFSFPFVTFKELFNRKNIIDIIHLQHEFFIYGGKFSSILFILLLSLLRILKKPVIVTLHHGFIEPNQINKSTLDLLEIGIPPLFFRLSLKFFFKFTTLFSSSVIVHEDFFKKVLFSYGVNINKIFVIPHGINDVILPVEKVKARKYLGISNDKRILLFFGYLSKSKGLDLLIDSFSLLTNREQYLLLIIGGEHPRLKNNKNYKAFLNNLFRKSEPNIKFLGFVDDEHLPYYFVASDILILPYKIIFASSGPLSWGIAYEKILLLSKAFKNLISLDECFFENKTDLAMKIEKVYNDKKYANRIIDFCKKLKIQRSWQKVAIEHLKLYKNLLI